MMSETTTVHDVLNDIWRSKILILVATLGCFLVFHVGIKRDVVSQNMCLSASGGLKASQP